MHTARSADFDGFAAPRGVGRFDFWVLCAVQGAALLGMYISIVGFRIEQSPVAFRYLVVSLVYTPSTAAIAARLPRKVGLPLLPVLEDLRTGSVSIATDAYPLIVGVVIGIIASYAAILYEKLLISWLGEVAWTGHVWAPNALGVACAAIFEEILFRAVIFAALAAGIQLIGSRLPSKRRVGGLAIANLLQAVLFGAGHIAAGRGVLKGRPWYVRLPLMSQTWGGMILGLVYWKYGIESAILCHATSDLCLVTGLRIK